MMVNEEEIRELVRRECRQVMAGADSLYSLRGRSMEVLLSREDIQFVASATTSSIESGRISSAADGFSMYWNN